MSGSDFGRLAFTVVGFMVGGPVGALVGSAAGSLLFPVTGPTSEGPRLQDTSLTTSQAGTPIPMVHGTMVVAGNVIDGDPEIEEVATSERVGGKGGGGGQRQTTYSYYATFALSLCEGPIDGIRRIWVDGDLVYDARCELEQALDDHEEWYLQAMENGVNSRAELFKLFFIIAEMNSRIENYFDLYLGTDDQEPAPELEEIHGAGNVPAYRGQAYLMFKRLPLEPYFNRVPQFTVEVARSLPAVPTSPTPTDDNSGWDILEEAA